MARATSSVPTVPTPPLIQQLMDRITQLEGRADGHDVMHESHSTGMEHLGKRLHAVEAQFPEGTL